MARSTSVNVSESYNMVMQAVTTTNQDRARMLLMEALDGDPHSKLACFHLGMIYAGRGLHQDAITWYRRIVDEIDEADPGVWFLLSRQYHLDGQLEEAKASYLKTLELDPLCEKACMYIASILIRQGGDGRLAVQFAEKAIALRPATSMVPVTVFERTLGTARRLSVSSPSEGNPGISDLVSTDLRRARLGDLVALGQDVADLLDQSGIRCAGCAGYEDETLDRAGEEARADVDTIVAKIRELIARRQDIDIAYKVD
jgi:tetratricopeptide (TPR) repeat protein